MFSRNLFYTVSILLALFCVSFPELANAAEAGIDIKKLRTAVNVTFHAVWFFCFILVCIAKKRQNFQKQPSGVGGWLTCFISFTLASQLMWLAMAGNSLSSAERHNPILSSESYIIGAICLAYTAFVIYSLWRLCRLKPGAVRLIKKMLVLNFIFTLTFPVIMLICLSISSGVWLVSFPVITLLYSMPECITIARTFIYTIVWLAYFSSSIRVQNTWNEIEGVNGKTQEGEKAI